MRRVAHLALWIAQPAAVVAIMAGIALVGAGRWLFHTETELRR